MEEILFSRLLYNGHTLEIGVIFIWAVHLKLSFQKPSSPLQPQ
jgi:hypothetical protein